MCRGSRAVVRLRADVRSVVEQHPRYPGRRSSCPPRARASRHRWPARTSRLRGRAVRPPPTRRSFTVALGNLPSEVTAGSPSSVEVTITDDDSGPTGTTPTVTLSASPNPVNEGSSVTIGDGDGDALVGALEQRDDRVDAHGGLGRGGRLRRAGEHHHQRRRDDRHGDSVDGRGRRHRRRDVHGGAGQPAIGDGTARPRWRPRSRTRCRARCRCRPRTTRWKRAAVSITAMASETVRVNTEVKLVRDGPSSTASSEDFKFDAPQMGGITILDGETSEPPHVN